MGTSSSDVKSVGNASPRPTTLVHRAYRCPTSFKLLPARPRRPLHTTPLATASHKPSTSAAKRTAPGGVQDLDRSPKEYASLLVRCLRKRTWLARGLGA